MQLINGQYGTTDPNLQVFSKNFKRMGRLSNLLEIIRPLVTISTDFVNVDDDLKSGILPFNDTLAFVVGYSAGSTAQIVLTKACIAGTGGFATPNCIAIGIAGNTVVGTYYEEGTQFLFEEVLTRDNICSTTATLRLLNYILTQNEDSVFNYYLDKFNVICD
ncbi:MAG: hypothetical protein HC932_00290 [Thermales bacterium]|nr:hypothetical protein [Thermales bacterium]